MTDPQARTDKSLVRSYLQFQSQFVPFDDSRWDNEWIKMEVKWENLIRLSSSFTLPESHKFWISVRVTSFCGKKKDWSEKLASFTWSVVYWLLLTRSSSNHLDTSCERSVMIGTQADFGNSDGSPWVRLASTGSGSIFCFSHVSK